MVNKQCRNLTVVGRSGRQIYLQDDDKNHFESDPKKNRNLNIRIIKHTADNRWGMVIDTVVTTATLLLVSVQLQVKKRKQHDNMRNQLFGCAFGRDSLTLPNLQGVEFHGDRGYFSEGAFLAILLLCGCMLTCTCSKGK